MSQKVKISLALEKNEIGNGPIYAENIWCKVEEGRYKVSNIPMFKENLSLGDLILVSMENRGTQKLLEIVEKSNNSTVWIYVKDAQLDDWVIKSVTELGCQIEGGKPAGNFAVNVPFNVDINDLINLLSNYIKGEQLILDVPSLRQ